MSKSRKEPRKKPKQATKPLSRQFGEDWLDSVEKITLRLDNGKEATFSIAKETGIPPNVTAVELRILESKSAARYAFWAYHCQRQWRELRMAEDRLAKLEAATDVTIRKHILENTEHVVTERHVRSYMDTDPKVRRYRHKLVEHEAQYRLLDLVRKAVEHRAYSLGRLLAHETKATSGLEAH